MGELQRARRIIQGMRYWLWFLLIVSLPLRAWVGDAMALEMLKPHPAAMQNIATGAAITSASAVFDEDMPAEHMDCAGHSSQPEPDAAPHCGDGSCSLCQVCHSVATVASIPVSALAWTPHVRPHAGGTPYASAAAALALKPPIS
jgi:hypothetical protein